VLVSAKLESKLLALFNPDFILEPSTASKIVAFPAKIDDDEAMKFYHWFYGGKSCQLIFQHLLWADISESHISVYLKTNKKPSNLKMAA